MNWKKQLPIWATLGRIAVVPFIIVLMLAQPLYWNWITAILFTLASITDWLDGYWARLYNAESDLGRLLDPIADKIFIASLLLVIVGFGRLDGIWMIPAILIFMREFLVSGLREFLAPQNVQLPVSKLAKWKTTVQLVAIALLLAGPAGEILIPGTTLAGLIALWLAALLTLYTGYDYFRAGMRHIIN